MQEGPYPPPPPAPVASETICLDDLFGTQTDAPAPAAPAPVFTDEDKAGASILNALFRDAAPAQKQPEAQEEAWAKEAPETEKEEQESAPVPEAQVPAQSIDLDDLFASATLREPEAVDTAPPARPEDAAPVAEEVSKETPQPAAQEPPSAPAPAPERGLLELLHSNDAAARIPPTLLDRAEFVQHLIVLLCVRVRQLIYRRTRRTSTNCTPSTAPGMADSLEYLVHPP